jgi:4-hydroxybenzoyl-CoA reductase alpha subunit
MMDDFLVIGKPVPRVDALEKVTGDAKFAADISLPGMLWCKILRSPYAHARILNIDTRRAEMLLGAKAVCTGKDFNGWTWGFMPQTRDEPPLAVDKVRYMGEAVAAVAAVDEETAEEATELISVDYEVLPGVFDPEEAMKPGAPAVHDYVQNNQSWEFHMDYGDMDQAFSESDIMREDRFETGRVITGYLEPPAAVAMYDSSGITLWGAKQSPYFVYRHMAACFGLPLSKIRIIQPFVGAGFGGTKNDSVAGDFCAVLFSKWTGRPVKFAYTMDEVLATARRRHNMIIYSKMGMKKDGTILALQQKVIAEGGAYTAIGPLTMYLTGCMTTLPYVLPNFRHDAYRIFTNHPVSAAMRGHGVTHTRFAAEIQMDMMAEELGIDPLEIRLRNAVKAPHETINGVTVKSCGLTEGLQTLGRTEAWKRRGKETESGRGVGLAGASYLGGARQLGHQSCAAILRLCEDGTVNYLTGATDCGQGSDTVLVQIVAQELGIRVEDVNIKRVDTAVTPCDPGSYGSRVTILAGTAARRAAQDIKAQLAEFAAGEWKVDPDEIVFRDGKISVKSRPDLSMPFSKLAKIACYSGSGAVIIGRGYSQYGIERYDWDKGLGNCGTSYSFTAQMAEVQVDLETGVAQCDKTILAHDCGRPLNPLTAHSQIEGGAVQGVGQALYEEFIMDQGKTRNSTLTHYKMPLSQDVPRVEVIDIITEDPDGPFGAKEASEGCIVSTPPAVVSALKDATGIWFKTLPVTPEKIYWALKERKHEASGAQRRKT